MSRVRKLQALKVGAERLFTLACVFAVGGYFLYHAATGDHGYIAYLKYQAEEERLMAELEALRAKRRELEHKVSLLRPESLDPDMLDERARALLDLAHPRDMIIPVSAAASAD